ncbi:TIGR02281 family clan AA aspartic protease [Roseobacter sp. YSTF-M11]|uniref:TIGR02281 family clan AA aspartic protease n=1 Tax=Roseobacter insulae TaxID=2859783 RepID=A0A9X1FVF7_9RHOB|nr:TIGR02281 family clan AA aspartic protease [Roseobacter insulae]MBW4708094.1 TIGR02281 family clan AA aspartic protease [Roseobacter insulae]
MDSFDTGRLIYLIILGLMVVGWFFTQSRQSLNKSLQQAALWGFIFLGAIAAYGLWDDISQTVRPQQTVFADEGKIVVPRSADGHYYIAAEVNGAPVRFVLDTGATEMVLTRDDALAAGLSPDRLNFTGRAITANGEVRTAPVRLDRVTLGPVTDENLTAVVNEAEMSHSLLGMTYLQRWGKIEITGGELILTR